MATFAASGLSGTSLQMGYNRKRNLAHRKDHNGRWCEIYKDGASKVEEENDDIDF